ncbi:MAG TPA: outer membrane beta-barrel family protein [Prolixibacteraceae bacterium]|nr:outer membrane beta-barrel family protein [Prolixibacteraceae bacterium]
MQKILIVLFLFIATAGTVFSQVTPGKPAGEINTVAKNGKIKGKIIDAETKTPMEYANVSIYSKKDSKLISGSIANESGSFEIKDLPFGAYYIEANFIGFEKTKINDVKINPNSTTVDVGTIALSVSRQQVGAVDVIAERNRIEYKIDKKVINVANDINSAGGTAVTALENTPSVEVDMDGNVSLRGSSSFTVLVDGRPSVLSGSDALRQIPSSAIQNIEIITNPSVKYDPDGNAGIINVVMKKNVLSGLNGIFNVNAGSGEKYGTDLMLNYKTKKYNIFLGGNLNDETNYGTMHSTRESYSNDTTSFLITDGRRDRTRRGKQLKGGLDYYLSDKTTVTLSSQVGTYNFDSYGGGNIHNYETPGTFNVYSIQKNASTRNGNYVSADASFQSKFDESGMHKLEGTFSYRNRISDASETNDEFLTNSAYNESTDYLTRVNTNENSTSNDYRMKLDYTLPLHEDAKFEAGIQSRIENEKESFYFENYDTITKAFINNPKFTSDMNFKEAIHSVYSTYSGKTLGVSYLVGLRGEYNKRTIEHHSDVNKTYSLDIFDLFPSVHFSYEMASENQIMASYSKRVNRPDGRDLDPFPNYMNQYTIRIGNPNLKPEYTDSYEFSYMRKFGTSFVSLETFYRSTNNLMTRIQEMRDDGIIYMTMDNLNRDYSLGGELMGNFNFTKWLLVNTSFSLYDYKIKGQILGQSINKESTNYSGRVNATVKFSPDSRMQLTGFYRGPSVSAQGDQKGMMFTNLSYRQDFMKKKLSATLSVRDLLGTGKYEGTSYGDGFKSSYKYQREPRVVMLTLSYKINNYKMDKAPAEQSTPGADDMF